MIRYFITLCVPFTLVLPTLADVWLEGVSQPAERITVSSPVEEIVASVSVKEGEVVEKGAVLATLFATREKLEVKRLGHMITKADQDAKTARELFKKKIKSKSNLLEKEVTLQRLQVEQQMAQYSVDQRVIKSPVAGIVVYKMKDPGEAVARVESLFEIIDASKMKLAFFLSTKYLAVMKEGMEVAVIFPELPNIGEQTAKLLFIDPQVDSRSGLFRVRFEFDNRVLKIKPGLRVKVKLPKIENSK